MVNGKEEWKEFLIMGLEKKEVVLGLTQIREYGGEIMQIEKQKKIEEKIIMQIEEEYDIAAGSTYTQYIVEQWKSKKEKILVEKKIPQYC